MIFVTQSPHFSIGVCERYVGVKDLLKATVTVIGWGEFSIRYSLLSNAPILVRLRLNVGHRPGDHMPRINAVCLSLDSGKWVRTLSIKYTDIPGEI